jgi:hypothetical protein
MSTDKLDPQIKTDLFSSNTDRVISAITLLKEKGNKLYLPLLFELLASQPENEIVNAIETLLGSVKLEDSVPYFIEALENDKFKSIHKSILTACWQNGLDFAMYWPLFVEVVIREEWETSFEAFTVIENMDNLPEPEIAKQLIKRIESALKITTGQKEYFLQEILVKLS